MNTMKKNGGFTLVELIIVIAILAILSTGAIAGYSAYIQKANDAAVEAVLSDIYTSAVLANADKGSVTVTVVEDNTGLKITVTNAGDKFEGLFEQSVSIIDKNDATTASGTYEGHISVPKSWKSSKYNGQTVTLPLVEETTEPTDEDNG